MGSEKSNGNQRNFENRLVLLGMFQGCLIPGFVETSMQRT